MLGRETASDRGLKPLPLAHVPEVGEFGDGTSQQHHSTSALLQRSLLVYRDFDLLSIVYSDM